MSIRMIGIDHKLAGIQERERFSFTKKSAAQALASVRQKPGIAGCVLISTCNRMELYINEEKTEEPMDFYQLLSEIKGGKALEYRKLFVERDSAEAVHHLFFLTAGLESKILGEDQVLTQVKEALLLAREAEALDSVLEVLFRQAVTAAKKVKTQVNMDKENHNAARLALECLEEIGFSPSGRKCMVIGNGMMGKITALTLKEAGADVTVTIRQYRSGRVEIPEGCSRINYGERYRLLPECDLVFSATASPNITLEKSKIEELQINHPVVFVDLAVPRDIDPAIRELEGMRLYDIDDFSIDEKSEKMLLQYQEAAAILADGVSEFMSWLKCRQFLPVIQRISEKAGEEVSWRMGKVTKDMQKEEVKELRMAAAQASEKVIAHMLFLLRDELEPEQFRNCLLILQEGD